MKIVKKAKIKDYTTYKLSGEIKEIFIPENIEELLGLLSRLESYKIIGNGSNLIISEFFDVSFINLSLFDNLKIDGNKVTVGAGYNLMKLCRCCADKGLSGLEFASGIPGSVGGAIYMNAGAYGGQISDILKSATVIDDELNVKKMDISLLDFGYRDSIFKRKKYVCVEAVFELKEGNRTEILFNIKKLMEKRREVQPLEYPSAGSVFKNSFESAGRLIENAGLKGLRVGDAEISLKHANFIVNRGSASAEDVIELIEIVKRKIKDKYGIDLELEQEILKG